MSEQDAAPGELDKVAARRKGFAMRALTSAPARAIARRSVAVSSPRMAARALATLHQRTSLTREGPSHSHATANRDAASHRNTQTNGSTDGYAASNSGTDRDTETNGHAPANDCANSSASGSCTHQNGLPDAGTDGQGRCQTSNTSSCAV